MADEAHRAGEQIAGRFVLERHLGAGGFGSVWCAKDERDRVVALKLLHAQHARSETMLARFAREARILERLDHPNLAKAYAWSAEPPEPYLAMEYVAGRPLSELMTERSLDNNNFELGEIKTIFDGILRAAAYAHGFGVVHRDLKPVNVLITGQGRVKVLDFGLAKLLEADDSGATTAGRVLGTPAYLAPEQIEGQGVDERSDVFALGAILFELLTLRRAWIVDGDGRPVAFRDVPLHRVARNAPPEIMRRIQTLPCPRPSVWRTEAAPALDGLVAKATAIAADQRYANAGGMLAVFEQAVGKARDLDSDNDITANDGLEPTTLPGDLGVSASDSTPPVVSMTPPPPRPAVSREALPFEIVQTRRAPESAPHPQASATLLQTRRTAASPKAIVALLLPIAAVAIALAVFTPAPPKPAPAPSPPPVAPPLPARAPDPPAPGVELMPAAGPDSSEPPAPVRAPVESEHPRPPRRSARKTPALPAPDAAPPAVAERLQPKSTLPVDLDEPTHAPRPDPFPSLRERMHALNSAPRNPELRDALAAEIETEAKRLSTARWLEVRNCVRRATGYADPADAAATLAECLRKLESSAD